jgi:imidazole glycerol-phosphate synthase subunit HisF
VEVIGSQSVVVAMDVHRSVFGRLEVMLENGARSTGIDPVAHARRAEAMGAGEIFLTSVDRDGTMSGYDLRLVRLVTQAVSVPVIASGGAGSLEDLRAAVKEGGCSAVAVGSMFIFHGKHRAVLITYPGYETLQALFS